jgi:hypothetical protein
MKLGGDEHVDASFFARGGLARGAHKNLRQVSFAFCGEQIFKS